MNQSVFVSIKVHAEIKAMEHFINDCINEQDIFSFYKAIPEPNGFNDEVPALAFHSCWTKEDFLSVIEQPEDVRLAAFSNFTLFNYADTYDLHNSNWGIPYDVEDCEVARLNKRCLSIEFYSECFPYTGFETLSERYPDIEFEVCCITEGDTLKDCFTLSDGTYFDEYKVYIDDIDTSFNPYDDDEDLRDVNYDDPIFHQDHDLFN